MQKIGLFGGSFDPIHNGHLHIAQAFMQELQLQTVIFLPAGHPYHKNGAKTQVQFRLEMVKLAIEPYPMFAVSDCDLREGSTYSVDTAEIFKQNFPQAQLWWLMGMDSFVQLHTWKNWQRLVELVSIAVASRQGSDFEHIPVPLRSYVQTSLRQGTLKILNVSEYPISSSEIRAQWRVNHQIADFLPQAVWEYIDSHGLYEK